ncbi:hypothetical protein CSUI_010768 [Cystoisospora suis]|uniref:Protein DA1-like domain-containing protein n=1 Tax=Cystoisospora suis TaxID=483139 RepID=A0A2C6J9C2_9APIC|nr:hypothetical protein CSUI_010768 [Cystoisospora suis]
MGRQKAHESFFSLENRTWLPRRISVAREALTDTRVTRKSNFVLHRSIASSRRTGCSTEPLLGRSSSLSDADRASAFSARHLFLQSTPSISEGGVPSVRSKRLFRLRFGSTSTTTGRMHKRQDDHHPFRGTGRSKASEQVAGREGLEEMCFLSPSYVAMTESSGCSLQRRLKQDWHASVGRRPGSTQYLSPDLVIAGNRAKTASSTANHQPCTRSRQDSGKNNGKLVQADTWSSRDTDMGTLAGRGLFLASTNVPARRPISLAMTRRSFRFYPSGQITTQSQKTGVKPGIASSAVEKPGGRNSAQKDSGRHNKLTTNDRRVEADTTASDDSMDSLSKQAGVGRRDDSVKPVGTTKAERPEQFYCCYCGDLLRRRKFFASVWPELAMCAGCKDNLPDCHVCQRKAVGSAYVQRAVRFKADSLQFYQEPHLRRKTAPNSKGVGVKASAATGGLKLCDECAGLQPVLSPAQVSRLVAEAVVILYAEAGIWFGGTSAFSSFTDETREAPDHESVRRGGKKDSSFPFPIEAVDLRLLAPAGTARGDVSFGRCDTLTLSGRAPLGAHPLSGGSASEVRAVQRVLVAKGLPESVFLAHLVHELLHAFLWCSTSKIDKAIHPALEEGVCNALAARVLERRQEILMGQEERCPKGMRASPADEVSQLRASALADSPQLMSPAVAHEIKVVNLRLKLMETHRDEVYGEGYRIVRGVVKRAGLREALRLVRESGRSTEEFEEAAAEIAAPKERHYSGTYSRICQDA